MRALLQAIVWRARRWLRLRRMMAEVGSQSDQDGPATSLTTGEDKGPAAVSRLGALKDRVGTWVLNRRLAAKVERLAGGSLPPPPPPGHLARLFIVGCPRSGTTWVSRILTEHPAVLGTRESHLFDQVYGPLVDRPLDQGWRDVLATVAANRASAVGPHYYISLDSFAAELARTLCSLREDPDAGRLHAGSLVRRILDSYVATHSSPKHRLLVEKTPAHLHFTDAIWAVFPEARILYVLRDGRDVCTSMAHRNKKRPVYPSTVRGQAGRWARCVEAGFQLWDDARGLRVRYEDLKQDPPAEVARILDFAALPHDADQVQRIVDTTRFERHKKMGSGHHNRKGIVGDWKNHFTDADLATFREVAGDVFEAAGYQW